MVSLYNFYVKNDKNIYLFNFTLTNSVFSVMERESKRRIILPEAVCHYIFCFLEVNEYLLYTESTKTKRNYDSYFREQGVPPRHLCIIVLLYTVVYSNFNPENIMKESRRREPLTNLSFIQYLHEKHNMVPTLTTIRYACRYNKLDLLGYLYREAIDEFSEECYEIACMAGHLNVVKFLHCNIGLKCITTVPMNLACKYGHLEIMKYLHNKLGVNCISAKIVEIVVNDSSTSKEMLNFISKLKWKF